ncbi:MAG: LamG-like jellyroll fold domain-containing protein [Luteolibacter sp.]
MNPLKKRRFAGLLAADALLSRVWAQVKVACVEKIQTQLSRAAMNIIRRIVLLLLATGLVGGLVGGLCAQTLTSGTAAPTPGANDISQLSTSGNQTSPDGLNYYTDNSSPAGQTFTTGTSATKLVSVAIKTAGLYSGGGYGTPATTPTYYLRIYSMSGSTATLLITFSAANPGFTDGDWLQWTGINVPLEANKSYAFSFGIKPSGGGYAALAVATNASAGGEAALIPISGGAITTGGSHSFDAAFSLGLQTTTSLPATTPLPVPTIGWNLGNTLEATWGVPTFTAAPFYAAANAGFNAVRIPCAWDFNANQTTYQINPAYMAKVKQAVDWAIAAGMYVVMNDHWDGGWLENNIGTTVDPTLNAKMKSYWTQIATAFAGYDNHLIFAGANEPYVTSPATTNTLMAYYQTFVNAVRGVGGNNTNRWLVLQYVATPSWFNYLPADPTPGRLMVEYHSYTPIQFALISSDASWGNMQHYWGPAYHYAGDPTHNCVAPEEGAIDAEFQRLTDQYISKGIPVMLGEFGVPGKTLTGDAAIYNRASVLYYIKYVCESARAHGISPFNFSIGDSIIDWNTGAITDANFVASLTGGVAPPPPNGAPYAASGLTLTAGTGQVSLSWTAGSGATSYSIYRAAESGYASDNAPIATGITGTSYLDTGLNVGTTYYYQVVAVNASGPSGFSGEAHATTPGVNPDSAKYNFETDTQHWSSDSSDQITGVATSTAQHYAGNQSLAVTFSGTAAGVSHVNVSEVTVAPGATVTFRIWIPSGSPITSVEPFLQDYDWAWNSSYYGSLTANAWNTLTLTVPSTATTPLKLLGLQIRTSAAWSGTCYIDSVSWPAVTTAPAAPTGLTGLTAAAGSGSVTLNWFASATTRNYIIKRSTTNGGPYSAIATTSGTSLWDANVVNGTTYYYVVSAVNDAGESANSTQVSVTPADLRALYAFEGNALDTSGNGYNGTATSVTYPTGVVGSQAAQFNGASSRVVIPPSVTGDFTVALWVKTTDSAGSSGDQWWSGKGLVDGEISIAGADWGTSIVGGKFVLGVGSASADTTVASSASVNDGTWHHVAATRNTTTGAMSVYVDGVLSGSGTGPTGSRTGPTQLSIGSLQTGSNYLNGTIDEVRMYARILTSTEINNLAVVIPPSAPTGLSATGAGNSVNLSWFTAIGATGYNVKRSGSSGGSYTTIATNLTAPSYLDSGLTTGATYYYVVSALNAAGESQNSPELGVTLASTTTVTGTSLAASDGYVRASNSANTAGGSTFATTNPCRLGDDSSNRQYKGIFSFDTSSLPDNAVIVSATLKFKRASLTGVNPFLDHGSCYVDIKGGTGFNGSTNLESADFQAAADATQVATMSNPLLDGALSTGAMNTTGRALIDKTGTTQFRVYFSTPSNANNSNDYISYYPGDDSTAANRPTLDVTYYLDTAATQPGARLKFDETSGTMAADSSGHGWHGTLVNGAAWAAGKYNNAVSLSGSAHGTLPAGVVSTLGDFTISTWVKLNSVSNWTRIFDFGSGTGTYMYLTPQNGSTGKIGYAILTRGGSEQQISGGSPLQTGTWTHVAVTLSGSTGTLYVNGVSVGTNPSMTAKPSALAGTPQNYIGRSQFSADPYLDGAVDEFRIYNRALSLAEIQSLAIPPVITSATTATGTNGSAFSYTITASNSPSSYSASGLPTGLSVNPSNGLISGTPSVTGAFNAIINATNAGGTGNASLTITVQPAPPAAPAGLTATGTDAAVSLNWSASGDATGYTLWRSLTSGSGYTVLAGGTTAVTNYADTSAINGTSYYYVVRATNAGGSSGDSNQAFATPLSALQAWRLATFGMIANTGNAADSADPDGDGWTNQQEYISGTDPNNFFSLLKITTLGPSGNDMQVSFSSVSGRIYRVERSDTLQVGSWMTVQQYIAGTGGLVQILDTSSAGNMRRFYRIAVSQ